MLTFFLVSLAVCVYGGTGALVARQSIAVDDGVEKRPFWKFLLFPIGTSHGNPGEGSACRSMNDSLDRSWYYVAQAIGWPIRLALNVPSYLLIGAPYVWAWMNGETPKTVAAGQRKKALGAPASPVRQLAELRRRRREIDEEVARLQADLKGEIEAEETVDPKFLGSKDPPDAA